MPKHAEVRPRGHYATKLGGELRLIQVDEDVWSAFDGDATAIEDALRVLARVVAKAKRGAPAKAPAKTKRPAA